VLEPDERELPCLLLALNFLVFFSRVEIGSPASQPAFGRIVSDHTHSQSTTSVTPNGELW
jgi:hypothetical protein